MSIEAQSTPPIGLSKLLAPVRRTIVIACVIQAVGAAAGIVPFIAVVELARVLLTDQPDMQRVWWIAGTAVAALFLRLICLMAAGGLTHVADIAFQHDMRVRLADHLAHVPLGWFEERTSGEVKKALQDDVTALHYLVGHGYTSLVAAIVTPLLALGYLTWVDWRLALACIVPVLAGIALYALQMRGYKDKIAAYNAALARVNAASIEFVQGIAVIKTFGQSGRAYRRFLDETTAFADYFWNWVRGMLATSAVTEIVLSPLFGLTFALAAGLGLMALGWIGPIEVLAAAILAPGLTAPFLTLAYAQNDLMLARDAAHRIGRLLNTPLVKTRPDLSDPKGQRVEFEQVRFSYGGETEALCGIDLTLEPGTVTALVGPSGSGKSTLARLLPRFWDPTSGRVMIGGVALDAMPQKALYDLVAFVFQDVQLLRATVRNNIAMGRPSASAAEIEAAARAAQIHDLIITLPRGYDSVIGEDALLSGGEAQRVSIARALLKDAPILVLDEATAFADPESEARIQDALSALAAGRTLLVIAHRLRTIAGADQICVLESGRIVERGRHDALLAAKGLYARHWATGEQALDVPAEAAQ